MANTRKYKQLLARIKVLKRHLLPSTRVNGNYTLKEQDQLRGYRLLVHAEIEYYFEEHAKEIVIKAFNKWRMNRTKSCVLTSIMTYSELSYVAIAIEKSTEQRLNKAVQHYIAKLQKNHGIKETNILEILLPIGIEFITLNQSWLNDLNSFGSARGLVAHSSARTQQAIDPVTEEALITSIINEMALVDEKINSLK